MGRAGWLAASSVTRGLRGLSGARRAGEPVTVTVRGAVRCGGRSGGGEGCEGRVEAGLGGADVVERGGEVGMWGVGARGLAQGGAEGVLEVGGGERAFAREGGAGLGEGRGQRGGGLGEQGDGLALAGELGGEPGGEADEAERHEEGDEEEHAVEEGRRPRLAAAGAAEVAGGVAEHEDRPEGGGDDGDAVDGAEGAEAGEEAVEAGEGGACRVGHPRLIRGAKVDRGRDSDATGSGGLA
jgi:hypothetical protein